MTAHERIPYDVYFTPQALADWAVVRAVALAGAIGRADPLELWEPGCGELAPFCDAGARLGCRVLGFDLRDFPRPEVNPDQAFTFQGGVDYEQGISHGISSETDRAFSDTPDIVITNPPFSLALPFVRQMLRDVSPDGVVGLLARSAFLAGVARYELFATWPPVEQWSCVRRPSFAHGGTERAQEYAVLFWVGARLHARLRALGRDELRTRWIDEKALSTAADAVGRPPRPSKARGTDEHL